MECVELETVYRTSDPEHLLFQNRIRVKQPDREMLEEYFGDRHWEKRSLRDCVSHGLRLAEEHGGIFTWLTATNAGAAEVCQAALLNLGIGDKELEAGFLSDPATKSPLRILARSGTRAMNRKSKRFSVLYVCTLI